ncbi:MAG: type II toxin-antitoxin system VapC family toxin [Thermoprotei archaeon]
MADLVDMSAFISRKVKGGVLSVVTLIEFSEWALKKYHELSRAGEKERALGYLRLIASLPSLLEGFEVLEMRKEDVLEFSYLVIEKKLDPADAYLAITAKKRGLRIATRDRDFLRVEGIDVVDP